MYTSKEQLFYGIWKYSDVFPQNLDLVNRIEAEVNSGNCSWNRATVGLDDQMSDYRDCYDFKMSDLGKSHQLYKDIYEAQRPCVEDYSYYHGIQMNFWEWTNVIKYGPGQHFQEHSDHGWSYSAAVSLVGYPNDSFTGGSLYFPKFNINIEPKLGDLYIFPSSYIYSHVAMPVESGTKYSFVTMLDYTDDSHSKEFDKYIDKKYKKKRAYKDVK